jgi:hypothetical protein
METIDEYLHQLDLPHTYELNGKEKPLKEFDGVAAPQNSGDPVFLGWNLYKNCEAQYTVSLSEDTPGIVEELSLEEFEEKLLTQEYTPALRTKTGYQKAEYSE